MTGLLCAVGLLTPQASPDADYLRRLAADTWRCVESLQEPGTGLPYDNSDRGENTSVTNIGLSMVSAVCAEKLGLVSRDEMVARVRRTLGSLEQLPQWFGFQQSWNQVKGLQPGRGDTWVSVLDSGNLCASLVVVAESIPEVTPQASRLLQAHKWSAFYDGGQAALLGGYNTETRKFNEKWRLDTLGTDATLAQFFCVASGAAPPSFWMGLNRRKVEWAGERMLWPAWEGGGLFMQRLPGLFLDLRGTELGSSADAFCRAQYSHGRKLGAPVWGWSACDDPAGGYLGWASLKDSVVTPYATALCLDTPGMQGHAVDNFRALEKLGARSPDRGFYDSVDWKTNKVSRLFLVLDQAMILIALTEHLEGHPVRSAFQKSALVRRGRKLAGLG